MLLLGDALLGKNNNFFGKIFFMQRIFEKATGRIWMIDNILDQRDVSVIQINLIIEWMNAIVPLYIKYFIESLQS